MARDKMDDGIIVNTEKATVQYDEATRWDGTKRVSLATGVQFEHQTLYQSSKGRYYIEHSSQWQGSNARASWVTLAEAAAWLILNNHAVPEDLQEAADEVEE